MTRKQFFQILGLSAILALGWNLFFPKPSTPEARYGAPFPRRYVQPVEPPPPAWEVEPVLPAADPAESEPELESEPEADASPAGIAHQHHFIRSIPLSMHVIRIERNHPDLEVITTLGEGDCIGLGTLTQQLRAVPPEAGRPVAAINGGFYRTEGEYYAGDPRGLLIVRGELVSAPDEDSCFWIDPEGVPHIGEILSEFSVAWPNQEQTEIGLNEERRGSAAVLYTPAMGRSTLTRGGIEFILEGVDSDNWLPLRAGASIPARIREIRRGGNTRIEAGTLVLSLGGLSQYPGAKAAKAGEVVTLSTATQPDLAGVKTALGGGPLLVHKSEARPGRVHKSLDRHPRSAVGFNQEAIYFVEVDGRQRHSRGISLPDLAQFLVRLQCEEAMNLDGGGSAEVWFKGRIMNRPCYGRERYTANTLVAVQKNKTISHERSSSK